MDFIIGSIMGTLKEKLFSKYQKNAKTMMYHSDFVINLN